MRYQGGKYRIAKRLVGAIVESVGTGLPWYEPFVGGGHVATAAKKVGFEEQYLSDGFGPTVQALEYIRTGDLTPSDDIAAEHAVAKAAWRAGEPIDGRQAWVLFIASFGSQFAQGLARNGDGGSEWYQGNGTRSAIRQRPWLSPVSHRDYRQVEPPAGSVLYCDPPYANTVPFRWMGPFDHQQFWAWAAYQATRGVHVFVSEQVAPEGWVSIYHREIARCIRNKSGDPFQENLWVYRPITDR